MIRSLLAVALIAAHIAVAPSVASAAEAPPTGELWYIQDCSLGSLDPASVVSAPLSETEMSVRVTGWMGCAGGFNTGDKRRFAISVAPMEARSVGTASLLRYGWPAPYEFSTPVTVALGEVRKVCLNANPYVALSCVAVSVSADGSVAAEQLDVSFAPVVAIRLGKPGSGPTPGCGTCWT